MKGIKKKIRDNRWINWILIFSNWFLQGIMHSDKTEKIYRLLFTFIGWVIFLIAFYYLSDLKIWQMIILGFVIGHTLNWIINGNFYNLIIHRLMLSSLSKKSVFDYLEEFELSIAKCDWVLYAATFGSICQGKLKKTSDIDVSIVRKTGFRNAINSILFSIRAKKYADLKRIPLEIYISDSPENSIDRFANEQNPVVLYDPEKILERFYKRKLSLSEAKVLNKL